MSDLILGMIIGGAIGIVSTNFGHLLGRWMFR